MATPFPSCSAGSSFFFLLLRLLEPGEELGARLDGDAFSLLLRRVVVLLPRLEAIFADNIIVVKLFEDGVQEFVRVLQSLHKMLQGQKNRQLKPTVLVQIKLQDR